MLRLAVNLLLIAMTTGALAMASGNIATIEGVVVLTTGEPARNAVLIVKDSWAGALSMKEREITRLTTDNEGRFFLKNIAYRHTLDLLVMGKDCMWFTGNDTITPEQRGKDGVYRIRIELLKKSC